MPAPFHRFLVQAFEHRALDAVLAASPAAIAGVSAADANALAAAFAITTVRALATHPVFAAARALLAAAGTPAHDPGPPPAWDERFARAPRYGDHFPGSFRVEYGPVFYRGRLDGSARVLVVGQDPSTDELLAHRVFIGHSGQRLQGLLRKIGVVRSYVMVNTFLYGVHGQFNADLRRISLEPPVLDYRNELLDRLAAENDVEAVITIGAGARHAVEHWPGAAALPVHNLVHPAAPEAQVLPNWNDHLPALRAEVTADPGTESDDTLYGDHFTDADLTDIPRFDLPFGVPPWHGTGGATRSGRNGDREIRWLAP